MMLRSPAAACMQRIVPSRACGSHRFGVRADVCALARAEGAVACGGGGRKHSSSAASTCVLNLPKMLCKTNSPCRHVAHAVSCIKAHSTGPCCVAGLFNVRRARTSRRRSRSASTSSAHRCCSALAVAGSHAPRTAVLLSQTQQMCLRGARGCCLRLINLATLLLVPQIATTATRYREE